MTGPATPVLPMRWALVGAWLALNVFLSHQPNLPGPSVPFLDKAMHAAFYAMLAFLLARAWLPLLGHRTAPERWALVLTACLLWGIADEIHQSFVPGRSADPLDVAADLLGAVMVWALFRRSKLIA